MIVLIAAIAHNGIIGVDGRLPWSIPADMRRFRALTIGHPLVMGRLTFESIGGALSGRTNIVMSRNPEFRPDGVTVAHSMEEAIDATRDAHGRHADVYIIGGEQVYQLFLPVAQRMELTLVGLKPEGDAVFPAWDHDAWRPTAIEHHDGDPAFDFVTLERVAVPAPA